MSESTIIFTATFATEDSAKRVKEILDKAVQKIVFSQEELFIHDVIVELNETKGINFDSMWYPQSIKQNGTEIYVDLVGSPSGTQEQDILNWVKLAGATAITGKAVYDDVFTDTILK